MKQIDGLYFTRSKKILFFLSITILLGLSISRVESLGSANSQSPKTFVFIGDSITIKQPELGFSYVNKLADREYWNEINIINSARSLNAIREYYKDANRIMTHSLDYNPNWLCINLGLADAAFYGNESQFKIEYRWLVDKVLEEQPNITIILTRFTWTQTLPIHVLNAHLSVIDEIAEDLDIHKIDLYNVTFNRPDLLYDGTHPNANGMNVIANIIFDTVTPIIYPDYVPSISTESFSSSHTTNAISFPLIAISLTITVVSFKRKKKE